MALAVACLGAALVVLAQDISVGRIRDPLGTRAMPTIVGGLIAAGGGFLAARRLVRWRRESAFVAAEGSEDTPGFAGSTARAMAVWGLCFGYVLLLPDLGFVLLSPPLLAALLWVMGVRRPVPLLGVSLITVLVLYGLFGEILNVRLPLGPLEPYLAS